MPSTKTPRAASETRYEYKPPKAEMRATQPNPILEGVSSGLGALRNFLDKAGNAKYPLPPGMLGAGHMLVGTAPEEVHEWASGFSPFSEDPNLGNRLDPRIKPGREQGLIDVAMTGADIGGLGLAGLRGGVRAAYPTLNPEVNMSRREFMGNTGKVAAGLAAASAVPFALRGAEHVAPHVAEAAVHAAMPPATHMEYTAARELAKQSIAPKLAAWEQLNPKPVFPHPNPERFNVVHFPGKGPTEAEWFEYSQAIHDNEKALRAWNKQRLAEKNRLEDEAINQVRADKRYEGFRTTDDAYYDMLEKAKEIRRKYGLPEHFNNVDSHILADNRDLQYFYREHPENYKEIYDNLNTELFANSREFHDNYPVVDRNNPFDEYYHYIQDHFDPDFIRKIEEAGGRIYDPDTHDYLYIVDKAKDGTIGKFIEHSTSTPDELREFIKNAQTPKVKKAIGGSVTMPDNYRYGGRVRMI